MATVPFNLECNVASGFVMDPNAHPRVGYVTALDGLGLPAGGLKADLTVTRPVTGDTMKVVGVLEKFSWAGGAGDLIQVDFCASQENAAQLKALQQMTLKTAVVKQLSWWIADYDQETKAWFEQAYPLSPPSGIIAGKDNPALEVDLSPVQVKDGIDVGVYKITIKVVPAANKAYDLHFANSAKMPIVKSWGLVVGTLAAAEVPPPS
jgi:hypothetical protein